MLRKRGGREKNLCMMKNESEKSFNDGKNDIYENVGTVKGMIQKKKAFRSENLK